MFDEEYRMRYHAHLQCSRTTVGLFLIHPDIKKLTDRVPVTIHEAIMTETAHILQRETSYSQEPVAWTLGQLRQWLRRLSPHEWLEFRDVEIGFASNREPGPDLSDVPVDGMKDA